MIKITRRKDSSTGKEAWYVNGKRAYNTSISRPRGRRRELETDDESVRDLLLETPIEQLHAQFVSVAFDIDGRWHRLIDRCQVELREDQSRHILFGSYRQFERWKQPFTVDELFAAIRHVAPSFEKTGVVIGTDSDEGLLSFRFALVDPAA